MSALSMTRILKDLGTASLYQDRELRNKAMGDLLRLAWIGHEHIKRNGEPAKDPFSLQPEKPKAPKPRAKMPDLPLDASKAGAGVVFRSNAYRSITRALAKEGRLTYRPTGDGRSFVLTPSEADLVRRVHTAMYDDKAAKEARNV